MYMKKLKRSFCIVKRPCMSCGIATHEEFTDDSRAFTSQVISVPACCQDHALKVFNMVYDYMMEKALDAFEEEKHHHQYSLVGVETYLLTSSVTFDTLIS